MAQHVIIPLGTNCSSAIALRDTGFRKLAYPFDWVVTDFHKQKIVVENNFDKFFSKPVQHNRFNVDFPHDKQDNDETRGKYLRRSIRFLESLIGAEHVTFVISLEESLYLEDRKVYFQSIQFLQDFLEFDGYVTSRFSIIRKYVIISPTVLTLPMRDFAHVDIIDIQWAEENVISYPLCDGIPNKRHNAIINTFRPTIVPCLYDELYRKHFHWNNIVCLGNDCLPRSLMTTSGYMKTKSEGQLTLPFDLMMSKTYLNIEHIKGKFENFLQFSVAPVVSLGNCIVSNNSSDMVFNHQSKVVTNNEMFSVNNFEEMKKMYKRRIGNWNEYVTNDHNILFICHLYDENPVEVFEHLVNIYPNMQFKLFCICINKQTKYKSCITASRLEYLYHEFSFDHNTWNLSNNLNILVSFIKMYCETRLYPYGVYRV